MEELKQEIEQGQIGVELAESNLVGDYVDIPYMQLSNQTNIEIFGNESQKAEMFTDLSKYFAEVTNPENTTLNTFFKAKYSPLNEVLNTIRPILGKYGFVLIQTPYVEKEVVSVKTILTHKSGCIMSFPHLSGKPTKNDIQGIGATISYLRRFATNAVAGVMGEIDDDGNSQLGADDKKPKEDKKPTENTELKKLQDEIVDRIKKLGGSENEDIMNVVKKYTKNANPYKTTDESKLQKLKEELDKCEVK